MRLDSWDILPQGLKEYLSFYGFHFSKKLCEYAVSKMKVKDSNGKMSPITPYTKEEVDALLKKYNIDIENKVGYDYVYVANMCKADYLNKSVPDEHHLALYIKDYVDDPDGYEGIVMSRYYADVIGSGNPIIWEDMI